MKPHDQSQYDRPVDFSTQQQAVADEANLKMREEWEKMQKEKMKHLAEQKSSVGRAIGGVAQGVIQGGTDPWKNRSSGMSQDEKMVEVIIKAKGKTAPRVLSADLDAEIVHVDYVKHISVSGQVLRWAVITTRNGFAVTGRPSASVSPENDDEEIGQKVAYANARSELWPLMGYALRENMFKEVTNG